MASVEKQAEEVGRRPKTDLPTMEAAFGNMDVECRGKLLAILDETLRELNVSR